MAKIQTKFLIYSYSKLLNFNAMVLKKISQIAIVTLLANCLISLLPSLSIPFTEFSVLAQTQDIKKVEADLLFQQGKRQFDSSQFQQALQSWKQSLVVYREIPNPLGVANSLGSLGNTYLNLGDYRKAIDYHQQLVRVDGWYYPPRLSFRTVRTVG